MFTRIHTVRFQNQLAEEAMRDKFVSIVDGFFAEGLLLTQFVDIDDTTLCYKITIPENSYPFEMQALVFFNMHLLFSRDGLIY